MSSSILKYTLWTVLAVVCFSKLSHSQAAQPSAAQPAARTPRSGGQHIVYFNNNNQPSLLYINSANGGRSNVNTRAETSDILNLILYPAAQRARQAKKASVVVNGSAKGTLFLTQDRPPVGPTLIQGELTGLTPGFHGFHIHALGDVSGGCGSTGGHYNPEMRNHGSPDFRERHVGDLGNIYADEYGVARVNVSDPLVSLVGPRTVIGRAVVVHADEDDLGRGRNDGSLKTGNAGGRVGCGVIGLGE